jgi:DNA (cytosine-5)-methyltransferase 1
LRNSAKEKTFFCLGSLFSNDGFLLDYISRNINGKETSLHDYFGSTLGFEYYYRHPRNYSRRAIYSIDEPSPTVRGVNRPVLVGYSGHPNDACRLSDSIRSLATLERALIQIFPPNFKWAGTKIDLEQMLGNVVPVKLAEFVARSLIYHINKCERSFVHNYSAFAENASFV